MPYRGDHTDHVANKLLLRTDLHTLFDLGEIAIDPDGYKVLVSDSLNGTFYEELRGVKISLPNSAPNAQTQRRSTTTCQRANSHRPLLFSPEVREA